MKALSNTSAAHCDFVFVRLPCLLERLSANTVFHYVHYVLWQLFAYRVAKELHQNIHFELVHHVTYGAAWLPSFMGWLEIPFIWGAGARDKTPLCFLTTMSWRSRIIELIRNVGMIFLQWITSRLTASRASLILTSSDPTLWGSNLPLHRFAVGGLSLDEMQRLQPKSDDTRQASFRIASVGRLLGWKGFSLALQAFGRLHKFFPQAEYWIFGDGPEREYLLTLAKACGCQAKVKFIEWLPRKELLDRLQQVHVLLHPSFHEQFGYVILESMAAEKPIICLDIAGPSLIVNDSCGFRVALCDPTHMILELSSALRSLMGDPQTTRKMGKNARKRAETIWSWESVGTRILDLYDEVKAKARCGTL